MEKRLEVIRRSSSFWANLFKPPAEKNDLEKVLLAMPPFANLNSKTIKQLMRIIHNRAYAENEYIFYQGDPGIGLYIVRDGEVAITQIIKDDKVMEVARLKRGDFFGEMALLEEEVRSGTAIALKPSNMAVIFKPDLDEFIEQYPKAGIQILRGISIIISTRLKKINDEFFSYYKENLLKEVKND